MYPAFLMEIYLIRHTTPNIAKGICYGQTDLDVTENFKREAAAIMSYLPANIQAVYCSPLKRCQKLAAELFPEHTIQFHKEFMELDFGHWEMQAWNDIPETDIEPWMKDFVNRQVSGGESYIELYQRVIHRFLWTIQQTQSSVIIAHSGVLRCIVSYITHTPLRESFDTFCFQYGCVIKLAQKGNDFTYEILYNCKRK